MADGGVALAAAFCAAASDARPASTTRSTDIILHSFISVPSPDLRTCKKDPDSITLPTSPFVLSHPFPLTPVRCRVSLTYLLLLIHSRSTHA
jgi:hypothetical protein